MYVSYPEWVLTTIFVLCVLLKYSDILTKCLTLGTKVLLKMLCAMVCLLSILQSACTCDAWYEVCKKRKEKRKVSDVPNDHQKQATLRLLVSLVLRHVSLRQKTTSGLCELIRESGRMYFFLPFRQRKKEL